MTTNFDGIDCFLFDLGGVIIDIDPQRTIEAFATLGYQNLSAEINQCHHDGLFKLLERGDIDEHEFIRKIKELINTPVNTASIHNAWNQMLVRLPNKRIAILETLKRKHPIYLLSNSNSIHRRHFIHMAPGYSSIDELFTAVYYSYELGCSKPESLSFEKVIKASGLNPKTTLFLDDSPANIEAAQKLGFKTELISASNSMEKVFA